MALLEQLGMLQRGPAPPQNKTLSAAPGTEMATSTMQYVSLFVYQSISLPGLVDEEEQ